MIDQVGSEDASQMMLDTSIHYLWVQNSNFMVIYFPIIIAKLIKCYVVNKQIKAKPVLRASKRHNCSAWKQLYHTEWHPLKGPEETCITLDGITELLILAICSATEMRSLLVCTEGWMVRHANDLLACLQIYKFPSEIHQNISIMD